VVPLDVVHVVVRVKAFTTATVGRLTSASATSNTVSSNNERDISDIDEAGRKGLILVVVAAVAAVGSMIPSSTLVGVWIIMCGVDGKKRSDAMKIQSRDNDEREEQ
jgi:hypothetical protein